MSASVSAKAFESPNPCSTSSVLTTPSTFLGTPSAASSPEDRKGLDSDVRGLEFAIKKLDFTASKREEATTFRSPDALTQVADSHRLMSCPVLSSPTIPDRSRCALRVSLIREELKELEGFQKKM